MGNHAAGFRAPPLLIRALWATVIVLVIIGVASGIARSVFMDDLGTRADPLRQRLLKAAQVEDAFASQRPAELEAFDARFSAHRFATLLHIVPGAVFLTLAPFQFSSRIRNRYRRFHRWSGRLLVVAGLVGVLAGLFFGLLMPFAGAGEATVIAIAGGIFLLSLVQAFISIRRRDVAAHRVWMIRAFAVALGISTIRVIGAALDAPLTAAGVSPQTGFVISLWIGWGLTLAAAELWIGYSRARALDPKLPLAAGWKAPKETLASLSSPHE